MSLTRQFDEFFYFSRNKLPEPTLTYNLFNSYKYNSCSTFLTESWKVGNGIIQVRPIFINHADADSTYLLSNSISTAAVTLLGNGKLDTLALGKGDPGLVLANDENVRFTGSEGVVNGILDVDNVETTIVALTVGDDTNTTHVTTTGNHGDDTSVELDEVSDLAAGKVNLDSVVDLDQGVGVTDAAQTN